MRLSSPVNNLAAPPTRLWVGMHLLFLIFGLAATLYFAYYGPMDKAFSRKDHSTFDINFSLSPALEVTVDQEHKHTIASIHQEDFAELQPLSQFNWLRLPLVHKPVWLRFQLRDNTPEQQLPDWVYLEFGFPVINQIDVYVFNDQGQLISHDRSGDEVPRSEWDLQLILPTVKFRPEAGSINTVYIRMESDSFLATPLFVLTADQLVHVTNWQRSFIIPYYGMILIMLFYNFFTYTFVRHKSYLYYFGHIFFLLLYQAVMDGFIHETLIKVGDWLYLRGPVVYAGLANVCAMNFTRYMLEISKEDVWEDRTLKACIGFVVLSLLLELFLHNRISSAAMMITYSVNSLLALVVIFSIFRKGYKLAGYFLVAWATYPILVTTYGLTMMGMVVPDQLSAQAPRLGGILETILLSVALGYRVELMRREKLQLQQSINAKLQQEIQEISHGIQALAGGNLSYSPHPQQGALLANLAHDFERLATALRTTEQDRNRWLSDISHELKTPISVFKATIESLQDGVFEINEQALERLHKEATRLERLVLDLHDLNLCESGGFNFSLKPVNIPEVLAHEIEFFKPLLDEQQLDIALHLQTGNALVNADEKRIAQLFANLLNNSAHYTDSPGRIKVVVSKDDAWLTIEWEDSAPGVTSPGELERLFDRLYKVDRARSRDNSGTGLGLSICKAIVEAHHGSIRVTESALGGLKFIVKLPLQETRKALSKQQYE